MFCEHTHHFVTAKELGQYLKLTPATVINLTVRGVLPGFRIGKSWRFVIDEVTAAINESKDDFPIRYPSPKDNGMQQ